MAPPRAPAGGTSTPAERKNAAVWELIHLDNYKQALALCNRRIKKGEKSEYLLALKALILTKTGPENEALVLAQKLSTQTPPTNSPEMLKLLSSVWDGLGDAYGEDAAAMWERSVRANPKDENLARDWFYASIHAQQWLSAQKAAMVLQKTFTKRREYLFWAVVTTLLLHNSLPKDSPQRKLFGTLAYRMIDKARTETPEDTTVIPARAIQTEQEVNLLLELLPHVAPADPVKEALAVLNSTNLGVDSKIGSGDWWGLARKRVDLLDESKDWQTLYDNCSALLAGVHVPQDGEENGGAAGEGKGRGDDWRVWDGFVEAAAELGNNETAQKALETILAHRKNASTGGSRNADLALVKFASLFNKAESRPDGTPTLQDACKEYFERIGGRSCCFEDLERYLQKLDEAEQTEFLDFVKGVAEGMDEDSEKSRITKTALQINHQKFIYLLKISALSEASESATFLITPFITTNLNIYAAALTLGSALLVTDDQYGDDAALLACMGLIRLYFLTSAHAPLYQATSILSAVIIKSRHNYQALILLLRIYLLVGAVPLALDVYPRLSIKQIQNDTLSHYLLTRISSLYPSDPRVPQLLHDSTGIYESSANQTPGMLQLAFDRGSYAKLLDFLEFSERVAGSVCRSLWEIELARLSHIVPGMPATYIDSIGTKHDGTVYDNRDFEVVMNCERADAIRFGDRLQLGPRPGRHWVRAMKHAEDVLAYLDTQASLPAPCEEQPAEEFTAPESQYLTAISHITAAIIAVSSKTPVQSHLEALATSITTAPLSPPPSSVDWTVVHALLMHRYTLNATQKLLMHLITLRLKPPIEKPLIVQFEVGIKAARADMVTMAQALVKSLDDDDAIQTLIDEVLDERGVGRVLRREPVFGGVEAVADQVRRIRQAAAVVVGAAGDARGIK